MSHSLPTYPDLEPPRGFTQEPLAWAAWLPPLPEEEFTPLHWEALVDKGRAKNPYFALLARAPEILRERTKTDNDIFYSTEGGLPRAERELGATTASRVNGCVFCASVHSRFATQNSGRRDDVQRLLDEGVKGQQEPRWRALIDAFEALTSTPVRLEARHLEALREQGLDDLALADAIHSTAFFQWANRLMLSLGQVQVSKPA